MEEYPFALALTRAFLAQGLQAAPEVSMYRYSREAGVPRLLGPLDEMSAKIAVPEEPALGI